MIDATHGFTKQLGIAGNGTTGTGFRRFPVKTLALHFYVRAAHVSRRQTPACPARLTNRPTQAFIAFRMAAQDG
ncbi:hypothetical protein [Burkholderia cepacia]|uniref:hypothetical protein n=1 Tax=Burkholderia cepacia TaxID=292 RepID=UPI0012DB6255|nr:hypothetical protein [Burkholderia cepacia]